MRKIDNLPCYDLFIDEMSAEFGVSVMSLVDSPAVEKNFIALSGRRIELHLDSEKKIITGVALRADFPIYRIDEKTGKEYYFTISPSQMLKIVQKFMREKRIDSVNLMHDSDLMVDDVYLIESFILSEKLKPAYPEFLDVEAGSWLVSYKVDNVAVWNLVKENKLRGFSVELTGFLGIENKNLIMTEQDEELLFNVLI